MNLDFDMSILKEQEHDIRDHIHIFNLDNVCEICNFSREEMLIASGVIDYKEYNDGFEK